MLGNRHNRLVVAFVELSAGGGGTAIAFRDLASRCQNRHSISSGRWGKFCFVVCRAATFTVSLTVLCNPYNLLCQCFLNVKGVEYSAFGSCRECLKIYLEDEFIIFKNFYNWRKYEPGVAERTTYHAELQVSKLVFLSLMLRMVI